MKSETEVSDIVRSLARAPHLVVALDLDGTLIPFGATPRSVSVDEHASEILAALAGARDTRVAIVSGRPKRDLEALLGSRDELWLAAEHGAWTRDRAGWRALDLEGTKPDEIARTLEQICDGHAGAWVERKTWSVCMHYREVPVSDQDPLIVEALDAMTGWLAAHEEFEILEGSCVLEVRHRAAHKGRVIEWLRERTPAGTTILALGDDVTDEDAFDALAQDDVAIAVGRADRPTRAVLRLADSAAVRGFLRWLARARIDPAVSDRIADIEGRLVARATVRNARLAVLSNRLPAEQSDARSSPVGGLVSGVASALAAQRGVWLGWSGQQHDSARLAIDDEATPPRAAFDLRPEWHDLYYNGFANRALWPVLHGFIEHARFREDEWRAYVEVNDLFAEHTTELAARDATIWAHDYHLLLVGRALRVRGHLGRIGFFLHVPFPAIDAIEIVPHAREIVGAMLSFDLLGFHTRRHAGNFVRAACELLDARAEDGRIHWQGRVVRAGVFPLGIDPAEFRPSDDPDGEIADLSAALRGTGARGRTLVLGVDRLDYTKGILERLDAFARMLELHPEWRGRVSLLQVAVPSRQDVPEYAKQRRAIETAVGRINGEHGEAHWVPVRYVCRSYGRPSLARLYRAAAVALVTPLRDGMNLVAKEYVAAQDPIDPGVLVLSRFAGAADELGAAILTNPYDRDGLAEDLARALTMPLEERLERHARLTTAIGRNSPAEWAARFLRELAASA